MIFIFFLSVSSIWKCLIFIVHFLKLMLKISNPEKQRTVLVWFGYWHYDCFWFLFIICLLIVLQARLLRYVWLHRHKEFLLNRFPDYFVLHVFLLTWRSNSHLHWGWKMSGWNQNNKDESTTWSWIKGVEWTTVDITEVPDWMAVTTHLSGSIIVFPYAIRMRPLLCHSQGVMGEILYTHTLTHTHN